MDNDEIYFIDSTNFWPGSDAVYFDRYTLNY